MSRAISINRNMRAGIAPPARASLQKLSSSTANAPTAAEKLQEPRKKHTSSGLQSIRSSLNSFWKKIPTSFSLNRERRKWSTTLSSRVCRIFASAVQPSSGEFPLSLTPSTLSTFGWTLFQTTFRVWDMTLTTPARCISTTGPTAPTSSARIF